MKRNKRVQVMLSTDEFKVLERKAEQLGLTLSSFIRLLISNAKLNLEK